jgi:hypothetical protein
VQHRELQAALAHYGVTPYTLDLQYDLERALAREGVSLLDPERLEAAMAALHLQTYPEAKGRPTRLHFEVESPLED